MNLYILYLGFIHWLIQRINIEPGRMYRLAEPRKNARFLTGPFYRNRLIPHLFQWNEQIIILSFFISFWLVITFLNIYVCINDFSKTVLDSKHVLKVCFKPSMKSQDFLFLQICYEPVWLKIFPLSEGNYLS